MAKTKRGERGNDTENGASVSSGEKNIRIGDGGIVKISRAEEIKLDPWQLEVLNCPDNIVLRSGRQTGKSTIIALKAAKEALFNNYYSVMIISATERQAYLLFSKVLNYLTDNYKWAIKEGKDRPTKSEIKLKNGSIIRCLPTGMDGLGIRGYTIDRLIVDEAAFVPEEVFPAVVPALVTRGGKIILLSTPMGKRGYFYERFNDPTFKSWHISTEEIAEQREEPQRKNMIDFLEVQRNTMTKIQYAQEFLGEFVDELSQWFPDELIKKCMRIKPSEVQIIKGRTYYLGVDIARMGGDETTFQILERIEKNKLKHVTNIIHKYTYLNETTNYIIELDKVYDFAKIYIDDGGLGVGVADYLLENDQTKRKTITINNRKRSIEYDPDKPIAKKLLKNDLYNNLRALMERGEIDLLVDDEVFYSLKSVQYEIDLDPKALTKIKIYGNYTHIAEGLIRAAWGIKEKHLNLWICSF